MNSDEFDREALPTMEELIDQLTDDGKLEVVLLASGAAAFRKDFNKARDNYRKALGEDADKRRSTSQVSTPFKGPDGEMLVRITYTLAGGRYKARMGNKYGIREVS